MARIDRLADAPKKTLQLASVIGREFTRRLLDRIADLRGRTEDFLRELKAIELIYEKSFFPELAYMFKHALTHDVAYNSLLVQRRRELHRLIGLVIEELYADRLSEHYEVLAHHFSRAEDGAKALDYLLKSAEKAANAFASREALALYRREGFAALAEFADPQIEIRMGYGINAGEYHGIEQALRFNADWEDAWAVMAYEVAEVDEIDAENVVARIEMTMRGEGSGVEVSETQWWLFELHGGRFTRWHLYTDRESAFGAARDG